MSWEKGRRAVKHAIDAGKEVKNLDRQMEGLRTEDPRRVALNDQRNAAARRALNVTREALRHGVDAAHLGDKLDENRAR